MMKYRGLSGGASGYANFEPITLMTSSTAWNYTGNSSGYQSERYSNLITTASTEPDADKRKAAYSDLNDLILDDAFVLTVAPTQAFTEEELPQLLTPVGFEASLSSGLRRSSMLMYHFRNAAQAGLMVYRNYFGEQKSMRKLTWSAEVIFNVLQQYEPDHVLMREALRDTLHTFVDADGALAFVEAQRDRPVKLVRVDRVPPLSFAMYATKIKEAMLVEDPFAMQERLYHQWWSELQSDDPSEP